MKKNYKKPDFTVRTISFRKLLVGSGPKATSVHAPGISNSSNSRGFYEEDEEEEPEDF